MAIENLIKMAEQVSRLGDQDLAMLTQEEGEDLASHYGMTLVDNCFVIGTKTDKEKLLNQVGYWIANDNLVKPRLIMKSLGFTNKMIKAYINDEQSLQRERPETSGHNKFKNKQLRIDVKLTDTECLIYLFRKLH